MLLRAPVLEQHPSHVQTLGQSQLPNHSWHQAADMLANGGRHTTARMQHDTLTAASLAHMAGRSVVKLEHMPPGQLCDS